MTEASYTAWDGNLYEWPPPDGWYQAADGKWWPDGYGPSETDSENGVDGSADSDHIGAQGPLALVGADGGNSDSGDDDELPSIDDVLPNIDDVFGGEDIYDESSREARVSNEVPPLDDILPDLVGDPGTDEGPALDADGGYGENGGFGDNGGSDAGPGAGGPVQPDTTQGITATSPGEPVPNDPGSVDSGSIGFGSVDLESVDLDSVDAGSVDSHSVGAGGTDPDVASPASEAGLADGSVPQPPGPQPLTGDQHSDPGIAAGASQTSFADGELSGPDLDLGRPGPPGENDTVMLPVTPPAAQPPQNDGSDTFGANPGAQSESVFADSGHASSGHAPSGHAPRGNPPSFDAGLQHDGDGFGETTLVDAGDYDGPGSSSFIEEPTYDDDDRFDPAHYDGGSDIRSVWPLALIGICVAVLLVLLLAYLMLRGGDEPQAAVPPGPGDSYEEAWEFGRPVRLFYEQSGQRANWYVEVIEPLQDGTGLLAQPSEELGDDQLLAVTRVRVTYADDPDPEREILPTGELSQVTLSAVSVDEVVYEGGGCGELTDPLVLEGALNPAEAVEGNLCWLINADDLDGLRMLAQVQGVGGSIYMRLT